ncbi:VCBS repeat-containing protein [Myxococcota bacterium]|nr:VCBS repeat-containing protein [Myxococcota bacterium]MBU1900128.1 VCBS repeat-containing protein [Myxococcota bacterium]
MRHIFIGIPLTLALFGCEDHTRRVDGLFDCLDSGCAPGYVCAPSTRTCVRALDSGEAAAPDRYIRGAPLDVALEDLGAPDAASQDLGILDAAPDATPQDLDAAPQDPDVAPQDLGAPDAASPDLGAPDAAPDAALEDLGAPDAAPDAALEDLGAPDAAPQDLDAAPQDLGAPDAAWCTPTPSPAVEAPFGLEGYTLEGTDQMGGALASDALWSGRPTRPDRDEIIIARGGRLEVFLPSGVHLWRSEILGIRAVQAVADLNGDGQLEIIASGVNAAWIFDAASGALRWTLPAAPLAPDGPPFVSLGLTLIADLDGDQIDDLYVTDGSCSRGGTGYAVIYRFTEGWAGERAAIIRGDRANGRCTRWNSLADLDGDGRAEILITDAEGMKGFDLPSDTQAYCFDIEAPSADGDLPHQAADILPGRGGLEILTFRQGGVGLIDDFSCPAAPPRWRARLGEALFTPGAGLWDLNGDGALDIFISAYSEGAWRLHALSGLDGAELWGLEGRLLALKDIDGDARPELILARGEGLTPPATTTIQVLTLDGARPAAPSFEGALLYPKRRATDAATTSERVGALSLDGALLVLESEDDAPTSISVLDGDGLRRVLLKEPVGAIFAEGGRRWSISFGDGRLGLYENATLRNAEPGGRPQLRASSGGAALAATPDEILGLNASGALFAFDRIEGLIRWRRPATRNQGGPLWTGAPPTRRVITWSTRGEGQQLIGLDSRDGALSWRHALDSATYTAVANAGLITLPERAVALRYDLLLDAARYAPDPACPPDLILDPNMDVDPRCPEDRLYLRTLTGLDAETGVCLWRTLIRPNHNCSGPSNQNLSVADADGDGEAEVYITETDALRRFDPRTGAQTGMVELGRVLGDISRGGGWVMAAGGGRVLRLGGNGPPDLFDADLQRLWRAEAPAGISDQAWVRRLGWVRAGRLWISPSAGWPLLIYDYDLGAAAPVNALGVLSGEAILRAPLEARFNEVIDLQRVGGLLEGAGGQGEDGLLLTDSIGDLYALDLDGVARWWRSLGAPLSAPLIVDEGAARRLFIPSSEGELRRLGPPPRAEIEAVWERPCPFTPACDPAGDVDTLDGLTRLCAEWRPSEGAVGYEARILGENDAQITPWRDMGGEAYAIWDGLAFIPEHTYWVEVRAYDEQTRASAPTRSDGARALPEAP